MALFPRSSRTVFAAVGLLLTAALPAAAQDYRPSFHPDRLKGRPPGR
ncbi:hypothetical protein [Brevundimonas sp. SH203]|nr:hypothetical protein [Brevundimonas sp. SH203]